MQFVQRNNSALLKASFSVLDTPTAATGNVTVSVLDRDGVLFSQGTATPGTNVGEYTFGFPATADLGTYDVLWTGNIAGYSRENRQTVEVIDGHFLSLAEARAADKVLADTTKYPAERVLQVRDEVLVEFERILNYALVTRYGKAVLDGTDASTLRLPNILVSKVISASEFGNPLPADTFALLGVDQAGIVTKTSGTFWTSGLKNITVEYEHGYRVLPEDLRWAAQMRVLSRLNMQNTGIPDRATSFSSTEGGTYSLATPGRAGWLTGIPNVDAILNRYQVPRGWA